MNYCQNCGKKLKDGERFCSNCGMKVREEIMSEDNARNQNQAVTGAAYQTFQTAQPISDKSKLTVALLCAFLGWLGVHRFYTGKTGTGILWLFTAGCFGVGNLVDFITILCGSFKDKSGAVIK